MSIIDNGNILITGASSGLGAEFARQLAPRARSLILIARKRDKLEKLANELRTKNEKLELIIETCDLSNTQEVDKLADSILQKTQIDVLINNAGLGDFAFFDQSKLERNLQILQVNVIALAVLTQKLLQPMVERHSGGIINIGSAAASVTIPCAAIYNGSKHFVNGFTESLALDLAGTGVTVTQVCPGPVTTEGIDMKPLTSSFGPNIFRITPEQCARETIKAFDAKKSKVYPGFLFSWMMWFYSWVPTYVVTGVTKIASKGVRHEEKRLLDKKSK